MEEEKRHNKIVKEIVKQLAENNLYAREIQVEG